MILKNLINTVYGSVDLSEVYHNNILQGTYYSLSKFIKEVRWKLLNEVYVLESFNNRDFLCVTIVLEDNLDWYSTVVYGRELELYFVFSDRLMFNKLLDLGLEKCNFCRRTYQDSLRYLYYSRRHK